MKKKKVKIITIDNREETLLLTESELEKLWARIINRRNYIEEYRTIDKKIITELDIQSIHSITLFNQ